MATSVLYTNSDVILSVLHTEADDVVPTAFSSPTLAMELSVELRGWLPDHAAVATAGKARATATASETQQWECLQLWCAYRAAASLLLAPLSLFKRRSDGEGEAERFPIDVEQTRVQMMGKSAYYQATLLGERAGAVPAHVARVSLALPAYDPVTG